MKHARWQHRATAAHLHRSRQPLVIACPPPHLLLQLAQQRAADQAGANQANADGQGILVEAAVHRAQRLDCRGRGIRTMEMLRCNEGRAAW